MFVILPEADPITLSAATCRSGEAFLLRVDDASPLVADVISVTLYIKAKALVDLDEGCGSIVRTCSP